MSDKPEEDFDHPCKNTCSGWLQGYEKGKKAVTAERIAARADAFTNYAVLLRAIDPLLKAVDALARYRPAMESNASDLIQYMEHQKETIESVVLGNRLR